MRILRRKTGASGPRYGFESLRGHMQAIVDCNRGPRTSPLRAECPQPIQMGFSTPRAVCVMPSRVSALRKNQIFARLFAFETPT